MQIEHLEKLKEQTTSTMGLSFVQALIKQKIAKVFNISLLDISIKFNNYREDYDFYIEVNSEKTLNDVVLKCKEDYRLKENEVGMLIDEYLNETFNTKIVKVSSGYALYISKEQDEYKFKFRIEDIKDLK